MPTEFYLQADAETVVGLARGLKPLKGTEGEPLEEQLDEAIVRTVALSSAGVLSPMASILGAVAAQEVLKVGAGTGREGCRGHCGCQRVPNSRQCPRRLHQPGCSPQPGSEGLGGGRRP